MRRIAAVALLAGALVSGAAYASQHAEHPLEVKWSFDGIFGRVDRQSAQRGYQVYKEVCSNCHSMKLIPFRSLEGLGFPQAEVKALAAQYQVQDGPNDDGDMFMRPGRPSDHFLSPFPNEKAARAANGGAFPPDLSLMAKAREDGPDYIYSLLTGFGKKPPADMKLEPTQHYNPFFPGGKIGMPAPLSDGAVTYDDGTEASVDQMARDVVNFLQWTAEPEMEERKEMGIKAIVFLAIFTAFFYFAKKRIWARLKK